MRPSERSQVSQIRTKRRVSQYPPDLELLLERRTPMQYWPVIVAFLETEPTDPPSSAQWKRSPHIGSNRPEARQEPHLRLGCQRPGSAKRGAVSVPPPHHA